MVSECKICHTPLDNEHLQINERCIDCFSDEWGGACGAIPDGKSIILNTPHKNQNCG
jgi:hypothetical protein